MTADLVLDPLLAWPLVAAAGALAGVVRFVVEKK